MNADKNKFDLEERTAKFAEDIVGLCRSIVLNDIIKPVVIQLIRSGTSVGANYCEANNASSSKDFKNKIFICKKEIRETRYWLRVLQKATDACSEKTKTLEQEAYELNLIFQKIITSLEKNAGTLKK